jgi:hypothetical protein
MLDPSLIVNELMVTDHNLYLTRQVSKEQILIYNDGLPRMTLGQLHAALWDSQSLPDVMQPGCDWPD